MESRLCRGCFAAFHRACRLRPPSDYQNENINMTNTRKNPSIWTGQLLHFGSLAVMLILVWYAWTDVARPFPITFWIAIAIPVAHQIFVWLAWRLELESNFTSRTIGFRGYLVIFFMLFAGRLLSLILLALLDRGSLGLNALPRSFLTIILGLLGLYAMYSVIRYFGFARAAGADHFDSKYRKMPLVKKGIFRFTNNGMYLYAFLLYWSIAFAFNSTAALIVVAFNHAYIWIHFYSTEKPDMDFLYDSVNK